MGQVCGTLEEISPSTYSWSLKRETNFKKDLGGVRCKDFSVWGNQYNVYLKIYPNSQNRLLLFMTFQENIELEINMNIELRHENETKYLSVAMRFSSHLYLADVKENLLEVICTVLNIKKSIKSDESRKDNVKNESCSMIKHNSAKIEADITSFRKLNGIAGLSENLKDVFLCEEDSDVTLMVGDQEYPAHKVILKARSPVFQAMLQHEMREKKEGFVNIQDCDPQVFRGFLLFLYTGQLDDISDENVLELYQLSDKYEVKDLKIECVDFLSKNLSVDMICDIILLATRHSEQDLLTHATLFFVNNAKDILLTSNWQRFVKEYPVEANELFLKTFNKISEK